MKKLILIAAMFTVCNVANAEPCNKQEQQKADALVAEYPRDNIAVKLAALRTGLCYYVQSKKITEEQASDIFDVEKQKMTVDKLSENLKPIT